MISSNTKVNAKQNSIRISHDVLSSLVEKFGNNVEIIYDKHNRSKIMVNSEHMVETAIFLRDNHGFDHVESAGGTDYPKDDEIEMNYHLGSYSNPDMYPYVLILSTKINRNEPKTNSLINIFPSVEYHERETYEMLGVYFIGHPRNERFLLPEDWADIPPLRKEFRIKGR